jgi:succinate dehydrogenase / fumarate reductase membrane anchor subunit
MVGREVIGAHYGWRGWLMQRVTAVIMLVYTISLLVALATRPSLDYEGWKGLWSMPVTKYATVLFVLSVLLHAWVGVRNIFMDYVKDAGVRLVLYALVILTLVGYGLWVWQILWGTV